MPLDPDYELWATQHALVDAQELQVLEFSHPAWGPDSLWLTNRGIDFPARTEDGRAFVAVAVNFTIDLPRSGASTQQELLIHLDALGGQIVNQIRQLSDEQRKTAIVCTYRIYLDTKPDLPVLDPLVFEVLSATANRTIAELRCAATILPNVAAGTRYTLDRFPTLAYL
jgi:uncharacterized protein DUF1833